MQDFIIYLRGLLRPAAMFAAVLMLLGCIVGCADEGLYVTTVQDGETGFMEADTVQFEESAEADVDINTESDTQQVVEMTNEQSYEEMLCVYICGAVKEEGVYELPAGSRVIDALYMAGGMTDEALSTEVNLAELLFDGEKIYFPTAEEIEGLSETEKSTLIYGDEQPGDMAIVAGSGIRETEVLVNINTADLEELMSLSGIGEAKASDIIAYRDSSGGFRSTEEIMNVSGIGESTYEKIKDRITVE